MLRLLRTKMRFIYGTLLNDSYGGFFFIDSYKNECLFL